MTTIAWDGKTLAADTLATADGLRDNRAVKIWRHGKALVGAVGNQAACIRFRSWVLDGMNGESPFKEADGNGLVVSEAVTVCFGEHGGWPVKEPFYTLGSGYQIALGALARGATAREAVEIAARFDTMTGGDITELTL